MWSTVVLIAYPNRISCISGMTSTMASVRGSRRIWMNSLKTIDQMRAIIVRAPRSLLESGVYGQPRLERPIWIGHADRHAKHQVLAVLLGLHVAWGELGARSNRAHAAAEHALREGVGVDADGLADLYPADIGFQNAQRQFQVGRVGDGEKGCT